MNNYGLLATEAERKHNLPKGLLGSVLGVESNWNPNARSPAGALGIAQIMPGTAKELGVDPMNPAQAIDGAARYLAQNLKRFGTPDLALAAYNAGPGNVQKHGGIPPFKETQNYVKRVKAGIKPEGKDFSAELFDDPKPEQSDGKDFSAELFGEPERDPTVKDKAIQSALRWAGPLKTSLERKQAQIKGLPAGTADIGDTILNFMSPTEGSVLDKAVPGVRKWNQERTASLESFNEANKDNPDFTGARILTNIAGTAGVGSAAANALKALSSAPKVRQFAEAMRTGGFKSKGGGFGIRAGGAGAAGGLQAGLVNPEDADKGALISAAIPGGAHVGGYAGKFVGDMLDSGAKRLMQSSLKPTIEQLRSGKAAIAAQTMLDEGVNATKGGAEKLRSMVDDLNSKISELIESSGETISKQKVIKALNGTKEKFLRQVSPTSDIKAIDNVASDFANHPMIKGDEIPVQLAQKLKQGTYSVVGKKYGQLGTAETEAQKSLARGLKEGIAEAVPDIAGLNARESRLLTTLGVAERRALMDANKNPMGLAILADNPVTWAAFMADKSALFKSIAARMVNSTGKASAHLGLPNRLKETGLLGAPAVLAVDP